jgi:hypothetical protein
MKRALLALSAGAAVLAGPPAHAVCPTVKCLSHAIGVSGSICHGPDASDSSATTCICAELVPDPWYVEVCTP